MSPSEPARQYGDASDSAASALGARLTRFDGPAKIRGAATYALEHRPQNMAHAVLVESTIASGRVRAIDKSAAEAAPGVLLVVTPDNTLRLNGASDWLGNPPAVPQYTPLVSEISYSGQFIAAVVAETFEQATEAARLLKVDYEAAPPISALDDPNAGSGDPMEAMTSEWGDAASALATAPIRIEREYRTPREYQTPIEPHGLIAEWQGDQLTIWEPSQWLDGMARTYAEWFGIPFENVRIISPYIGGGFGSKAFAYPHGAVCTIAAKMLGRPVKLAVTRPQTFSAIGGRAATRQTIALGATSEGKLVSIVQRGANETSIAETWVEPLAAAAAIMYATPNFSSRQNVARVNTVMPGAKRAPGENPSAFAIESAIDELAYELGIDPLEIRLLNYAEEDPQARKPWSTRRLREAFAAGAAAFGWSKRSPQPRSMREGSQLIGWGVAAGSYPVRRSAGEALVRLLSDGTAEVLSSTIDMGQGAYTVIAQAAAEVFGLPMEKVAVRLGDSALPRAGVTGGSRMANVMTAAVHKAALAVREELIGLALNHPASPFQSVQANTLVVANGRLASPRGDGPDLSIAEFLAAIGQEKLEARRDTFAENRVDPADSYKNYTTIATGLAPTDGDYSMHSWCAHFIEVRVDEDFGTVRVSRVVSALDSGRLYSPKLAESQWKGGIIMGIGQALLEEGLIDHRYGRVINNNLADYLIPTNADIPDIEVISVGIPDLHASALGGKGVGELGIVGVAPAIANAVFHATGKRIRELPITLDKLMATNG
ncbi:xanthine dehydrogenase family protein molybdopterin-binding subunit [Rhodoligotrophos ferricapiens]|uniref:xanthine dehydrogenase family protein molybdopterin-binding subunit n=1 Tax=Rhodoligotrophos ferricapiens TaxID=3069264 RepID=UPI00315CD45B